MTVDEAIFLMSGLIEAAVWTAGPVLGAALVGGVVVGVLQTATQINEMSVAYVCKAVCVLLVFVFMGTALASKTVNFTRAHFAQIADVVH